MSGDERSRRALVSRTLRDARRPLGVSELAERLGVHQNTVRFHLDALVADGAAERSLAQSNGPGRPRAVYATRPGLDRGGSRDYRFLARVLLSRFASDEPRAADEAREAGRMWGHQLVASPAPYQRLTADQARGRLTDLLSDLGFAPDAGSETGSVTRPGTGARSDDAEQALHLRHCPFLELAEEYGGVVCPLHLGLMQGALDELGAPIAAAALEPFGARDACVVRLERIGAAAGSGPATRTRARYSAAEGE